MVIKIILSLLFASGFHLIRAETSQGLAVPCQSKQESAVKFSVTSHQYSTGDMVYEVSLEREKQAGRIPWLAQVEDDTTVCDGVEFLRTTSTITYPAPAPAPGSCPCPCPTQCPAQAQCSTRCPATAQCPALAQCPAPVPSPTRAPEAGLGYLNYPLFGYYKLHMELESWHSARKICESEGAHLAIIDEENEAAQLAMILSIRNPNRTDYTWLGMHYLYKKFEFLTVFDEPFEDTGDWRWDSGQPNNLYGTEECLGMFSKTGNLLDYFCYKTLQFICEHK